MQSFLIKHCIKIMQFYFFYHVRFCAFLQRRSVAFRCCLHSSDDPHWVQSYFCRCCSFVYVFISTIHAFSSAPFYFLLFVIYYKLNSQHCFFFQNAKLFQAEIAAFKGINSSVDCYSILHWNLIFKIFLKYIKKSITNIYKV